MRAGWKDAVQLGRMGERYSARKELGEEGIASAVRLPRDDGWMEGRRSAWQNGRAPFNLLFSDKVDEL